MDDVPKTSLWRRTAERMFGLIAPRDGDQKPEIRASARMTLLLFGLSGAMCLAFLSATIAGWQIPALRVGFGSATLAAGIAALAFTGAHITLVFAEAAFETGQRFIWKFWAPAATMVFVLVGAYYFVSMSIGVMSAVAPCLTKTPPLECHPQAFERPHRQTTFPG